MRFKCNLCHSQTVAVVVVVVVVVCDDETGFEAEE